MKNSVKIYTDGACSNNQSKTNKGGYGAIILEQGEEYLRLSDGYRNTTNNRMELMAVIKALEKIDVDSSVIVYSDSEYVVKGITEWVPKWIKRGKIEKNGDLWMDLYRIVKTFEDIEFKHVKGHSNDYYNEIADKLARRACKKNRLKNDSVKAYTI
jgi:ribonuclease HI